MFQIKNKTLNFLNYVIFENSEGTIFDFDFSIISLNDSKIIMWLQLYFILHKYSYSSEHEYLHCIEIPD